MGTGYDNPPSHNLELNLETDALELYVLLPHADATSALALPSRLATDPAAAAAEKAVMATPKQDPVYVRFESQLMLAFKECPQVEVPTLVANRVLQLRIYESHNDERALKKVEMFNEGGEISTFRKCGVTPVFFGQSVGGTRLPNLTYMVGFESTEAQDAAWERFQGSPEWNKLKNDPAYADTVSNITNLILRPMPGSQI